MAKCVLAFSGGLDTLVAISWLKERRNLDVVAQISGAASASRRQRARHEGERVVLHQRLDAASEPSGKKPTPTRGRPTVGEA